jgi:hypothetical protein
MLSNVIQPIEGSRGALPEEIQNKLKNLASASEAYISARARAYQDIRAKNRWSCAQTVQEAMREAYSLAMVHLASAGLLRTTSDDSPKLVVEA